MRQWNNRIFISRAGADADASSWATSVLEAEGYECIVQERDFNAGISFLRSMHEAFEACDTVLAIMSPDYWQSDWCVKEWNAGFAHSVGKQGCLIPIMHRASQPPSLYVDLAYLDLLRLVDAERNAALIKTVNGVLKRNTPPPDILPRIEPPIANSPFITLNFTGREEELTALNEALWENRETVALTPPAAVSGLGGVGKSAIAREYARRNQHRYAGTWLKHQKRCWRISPLLLSISIRSFSL